MGVDIADTSQASTAVSGTFTPIAGRLYLVAVCHSDTAPEATVPTVATTTGLAFVQIGSSLPFDTIASNVHRITVFRALKMSGLSAGTYTPTLGDNGTGIAAVLIEINEVDQTGTDGSGAVVQNATNSANAGANPNATLAAFGSTANATVFFMGSDIQTAPTADTGWAIFGDPDYATPSTGVAAFFRNDNDTTATCTLTASDWAAMALEIKYAHNTEALKGWIPSFPDKLVEKNEMRAYGPDTDRGAS